MNDLFTHPSKQELVRGQKVTTAPKRIEASYNYTDADSQILFQVVRYQPKGFAQRRPDGKGGWINDRKGIDPVLYNLPAVLASSEVWVVEGEKDVTTLTAQGKVATCNPGGAGKWLPQHTEALRGKTVLVIPDNDKPGQEHARAVCAALQTVARSVKLLDLTKVWPEIPNKGDVTDCVDHYVELLGESGIQTTMATLEIHSETVPEYIPPEDSTMVFFDAVEYEEPQFLIKPYIPLGKTTIIQADSGVGKTALACKLAACVSCGLPMQTEPCTQGKVLMLSVEDDPATLRGRIEASGGDVSQCAFIENAHELIFTSEIIERMVAKHHIKLLVFDPLQAFLGSDTDMHRANETRPIMAHLAAMAKRTGCAVVIISHMSKGTAGSKAIYRALGSVDIPAATRSVLYVERNPKDEDQCVMVHIKSSNAKPGQTILYRIGDRGGVAWEGYSSLTVRDLEMQSERREKGVEYEEDPLVQVVTMLHKENPGGVIVSWEQLDNYANKVLGYFPCKSGKEWNAKLKGLQREITEKSHITFELGAFYLKEHIEFGEKIPGIKSKMRGVNIMPFQPKNAFQLRLLKPDEE